jgi:tetratricopeptide (TPR) repeat protein
MNQPPAPDVVNSPGPPPSLSPPRRWRRALLLGGAVLAFALGWWFWPRQVAPAPPEIALAGADPAVAEAITEARQAVLQEPDSAANWGWLGKVLRAHDFGEEANRCFTEAARLDPRDPRWPYLHALTVWLTDRDAAIPLLERAVELCGDSPPEPRLRLAEALLARGRLAEAEKQFRLALEVKADHPRAHLGLGRVAYQRDQLDAALDHLRRATASPYTRRSAWTLLAEVYQRRKGPAAGQQLGPLPVFGVPNLGLMAPLLGQGLFLAGSALVKLGPAVGLPEDPMWPDPFVLEVERLHVGMEVRLRQGAELVGQGQVETGIALLQKTVADYPKAAQAWLDLGKALIKGKDYPAAEEALDKAAALAPASADAWFLLGGTRFLRGNYRGAADAFDRAIRLKPNYVLAHYNLGQCRKRLGDRSGAIAAFRAALRWQSDYGPAQQELDRLLKSEPK